MSNRRSLLTVLVAVLALLVGLTAGCSTKTQEVTAELPDTATLLSQSHATTAALTSVHLELSVTGKIEHLPVRTLSGDLTAQPQTAAKGNAKITMAGADIDIDFVVYETHLYAAMSKGAWDDYGPAAKIYDPSAILNTDTGLANLLANFTDAKAEKHETIDGQDTIRISGVVSADAVNALAPQMEASGPTPATVWIQADDPHQLVQAQLNQSSADSVQMTLSNWDAPVTVDKPAV